MNNEAGIILPAVTLFAPDETATNKIGALLAGIVNRGDLVLLCGELGAGKSALARALVRTLLATPDLEVPSPTFLLVLPYQGEEYSVLHVDLYRLNDPREAEELGLFDDQNAVVLVEWPQRAPELEGQADLRISLEIPRDGQGRRIKIRSLSGRHDLSPLRRAFQSDATQ